MKIRKLFSRPVTKREIYKRLCKFIDENYEGFAGWGKADTLVQRAVINAEPLKKPESLKESELKDKVVPQAKTELEPEKRFSLVVEPEKEGESTSLPGPRYSVARFSRERNSVSKQMTSCDTDGDFEAIFNIFNKRTEQATSRVERVEKLVAAAEQKDKFSASMMHIIAAKGLTDAQVYNNVFMDRRPFNKIRNNPNYQPSKRTAILIAVSLKLTYEETQSLLETAGYTLTHSNKFDLIVEFFIREGNYDVFEINEMLEHFKQPLLVKGE